MTVLRLRWSVPLVVVIVALVVSVLAEPDSSEAGPPTGPFAYVANRNSGLVAVIDLASETEVASIATGEELSTVLVVIYEP